MAYSSWEWLLLAIVAAAAVIVVRRGMASWRVRRRDALRRTGGGTSGTPDAITPAAPDRRGAAHDVRRAPAGRLVLDASGAPRVRCECCGYLTRALPIDRVPPHVDWLSASCPFCDWENAPVDDDGAPDPEAPSPEERNDGHTLAEARENVRRYRWMYDPAQLEPWMAGPPSDEELSIKSQLQQAYEDVERDAADRAAWDRVFAGESALRAARKRRAKRLQRELRRRGRRPHSSE